MVLRQLLPTAPTHPGAKLVQALHPPIVAAIRGQQPEIERQWYVQQQQERVYDVVRVDESALQQRHSSVCCGVLLGCGAVLDCDTTAAENVGCLRCAAAAAAGDKTQI